MTYIYDTHKHHSMNVNYIFYPIVSLAVATTLTYLNKATKKNVTANESGEFILRMHKLYKITGYIAIVIGLIVTIGPIFSDKPGKEIYLLMFLMFLIFIGLGTLSVLYYENHYLLFDNSKIEVRNALGKTKTINWNDVQKAKFNPTSGLLTLSDSNGIKVRIHQHLVGLGKFITCLESRTHFTAAKLRLPIKGGTGG